MGRKCKNIFLKANSNFSLGVPQYPSSSLFHNIISPPSRLLGSGDKMEPGYRSPAPPRPAGGTHAGGPGDRSQSGTPKPAQVNTGGGARWK